MALEWIKSYKKLERDPKTLHFKALMRWSQSETIGFLHRFWWWADDVAADGNVTSLCLPGVVGGALGYSSDIGDKAVEKMKESHWLDTLESGEVVIHNVDKYRASTPEKREADRERKRRSRKSRPCHTDVTRDKAVTKEASQDVTLLDEEEDKEEETTHTHTGACGNFEASMSPTYQRVLSAFSRVTGRMSKDPATKEGARELAQAINSGELDESHLDHVIEKGMGDPDLKNQTLRGVARNFGNYLPDGKPRHPSASRPPAGSRVREMALAQGVNPDDL